MDDIIDVPPREVVKSCVKVRMYISNFQLKARDCTVIVEKYDENIRIIDVANVYINPEEYAIWANDDDYIVDLVLDKLGLRDPETEPEPAPEEPAPEEPVAEEPVPEEPVPEEPVAEEPVAEEPVAEEPVAEEPVPEEPAPEEPVAEEPVPEEPAPEEPVAEA